MSWQSVKIGILGGGQLGKMLCEAASPMGISLHLMDKDKNYPAGSVCQHFFEGDFTNYKDVLSFGEHMNVISIEIENVNTDALKVLRDQGKKVFPEPEILEMIKDKGLQKKFYRNNSFPTSDFQLFNDKKEAIEYILKEDVKFPFFQKLRKEGYDGRGVQKIASKDGLDLLWDKPSLIEDAVEIEKEIAVIVARDQEGNSVCYPPVEMHFHPTANLLEYQMCPAAISEEVKVRATKLAADLAEKMGITGLLAVEMFVQKDGDCLINEVAPRPHNSGHHTIEAHQTSQYEQLVRILAGIPLGSSEMLVPSLLLNILGEPGYTGEAKYVGVQESLSQEGVHLHLYGKLMTKPFRKMGHICITERDLDTALEKANFVREKLKVIS